MNEHNLQQEFPTTIQEQFQLLMSSRETFLKKISIADGLKLNDLYEELVSTWNLNSINKLKRELELKSMELTTHSEQAESRISNFKKEQRMRFSKSLRDRLDQLEDRKAAYQIRKLELSTFIKKLKEDINEKQKTYSLIIETLNQELIPMLQKSESADQQLNLEEEKLKMKSMELKEILLKEEEESKQFKSKQRPYTISLSKTKGILDMNMNNLKRTRAESETKLMRELGKSLLAEFPDYPEDLRELMTSGEFSTIRLKYEALLKELETRGNALDRELSKIGLNKKVFLEKLDRNSNQNLKEIRHSNAERDDTQN